MKRTAVFLCCMAVSLSLSARSLKWKSLDVEAKLEKSGQLYIRERHAMVFDGDWNGGKRVFRVEPGQS